MLPTRPPPSVLVPFRPPPPGGCGVKGGWGGREMEGRCLGFCIWFLPPSMPPRRGRGAGAGARVEGLGQPGSSAQFLGTPDTCLAGALHDDSLPTVRTIDRQIAISPPPFLPCPPAPRRLARPNREGGGRAGRGEGGGVQAECRLPVDRFARRYRVPIDTQSPGV